MAKRSVTTHPMITDSKFRTVGEEARWRYLLVEHCEQGEVVPESSILIHSNFPDEAIVKMGVTFLASENVDCKADGLDAIVVIRFYNADTS